jgi:hypothetical protein
MMNGEACGKQRGFLRASRHSGEKAQRMLLEEHKVSPIYNAKEHDLDDLIRSLRPGDEVWVTTMGRLASRRADLKAAVEAIHSKKAVIVEAASGRRSNRAADAAQMALDAADELALDARGVTPAQARRFGKLGGEITRKRVKREMEAKRLGKTEAGNIWRNPLLTGAEALAKMPGWTLASAYRILKKRGLAKGRPRSEKP